MPDDLGPMVVSLIDQLVQRIATRVADELRGGNIAGFLDQGESPLGRRKHIRAVRSGELPGVRVGRRYLVRREDMEAFIARCSNAAIQQSPVDQVDALATELGFKRPR